ncbi:MAG: hypothetical protein HFJ48_01240 [Clostridia bacterium]|nr:hypothetical protein [Clostridia bacterium]
MSVNLEIVEFKDNQEPAINAENLNQMQTNTQNAINKVTGIRDFIEISKKTNQNIAKGATTIITFTKDDGDGITLAGDYAVVSEDGIYLIELDLHFNELPINTRAFGDILITNNNSGSTSDTALRTNDTQQCAGDTFLNATVMVKLKSGAKISFKVYVGADNALLQGSTVPSNRTRAFIKKL